MTGKPPVTFTIDDVEISVPKGTLIIRAAEQLGIEIPRFCDHPLLEPVGACRQCIVEVEGQRKPVTSCTVAVSDGMVVKTQRTSDVAEKAQRGTMELLLINHPLDCPICDKGGECPLQNQAMSAGRSDSRFYDVKRTYPKPIAVSSEILLDRERCVLCTRCTRFSQQIAGDPFIELFERSSLEQVAVFGQDTSTGLRSAPVPDVLHRNNADVAANGLESAVEPFSSYFSGNTVQICPVGALTSAAYRFRARPFDLVSTPSVCEHCASGCAQRTDWRRGRVMRRLAGDDPEVNEEWNCDKGRFAFTYPTALGRITTPLVRDEHGELQSASWTDALTVAAEGLREARDAGGVGVLAGGRLTFEDAYAYSKFARVVLGTNDVDFRARPHSAEEAAFLESYVAGRTPSTGGVTYRALEAAPAVLLVGFEPEEESPIVFLRLRKAVQKGTCTVYAIAPWATRGLEKLSGTLIETAPGAEPNVLSRFSGHGGSYVDVKSRNAPKNAKVGEVGAVLRQPGAVILVGERMAAIPGALSTVARLAEQSGAALAWVPRRASERGALAAGLLPTLLPGERSVADEVARATVAQIWGVEAESLPVEPGRDADGIIAAAQAGQLNALVVGGVDTGDLADPAGAEAALEHVGFVVSCELRASSVTAHADVVFPVAPAVEKDGTYLNWEGRERPFAQTLVGTGALTDAQVLAAIAAELDTPFGPGDVASIQAEWRRLQAALGPSAVGGGGSKILSSGRSGLIPSGEDIRSPTPQPGEAVLATWHHLLDLGSLQDNEEHLAGTAPAAVARLSESTAQEIGIDMTGRNGTGVDSELTISTERGAISLPLMITPMPDRVVWIPTNSIGSTVHRTLGVTTGALVRISRGASGRNRPDRSLVMASPEGIKPDRPEERPSPGDQAGGGDA